LKSNIFDTYRTLNAVLMIFSTTNQTSTPVTETGLFKRAAFAAAFFIDRDQGFASCAPRTITARRISS